MFLGFLRLLNSAASAHFMQIRSETLSVALHLFEWMCSSSLLEMQLLPVVFFQALSTLSSIVVQLGLSHNQNSWPSVHSLTLECCSSSCTVMLLPGNCQCCQTGSGFKILSLIFLTRIRILYID